MIDNWPYIVSGFCGAMLALIIIRLVFNESFRKDMTSTENTSSAKLFNLITVQGAFIIVLCGMVFFGLLYPVVFPNAGAKVLMEASGISEKSVKELINAYVEISNINKDANKKIKEIEGQMVGAIKEDHIEQYIENLSPSSPLAQALVKFPHESKGPWSKFEKSEVIKVSIPGEVEKGHAWVCHDRIKNSFDLFSNLSINGEKIVGQTTRVSASKLIFPSKDCKEKVSIDMQISCQDAELIYTDRILSCDQEGNAQWKIEKPGVLSVLSVLSNEE